MKKSVHPIKTYEMDDNSQKKSFLLSREEIKGICRGIKRDITKGRYQLFRLKRYGEAEIIAVKKGSLHMKVLNELINKPTTIKTYVL